MSNEEQKLPDEKAGRFFFRASAADFKKIPGSPIAYWVSSKFADSWSVHEKVENISISDGQNKTGDNLKFLRFHWELDRNRFLNSAWIPYAKGGPWRKWFGNEELLVDWSDEARRHFRKDKIARLIPEYLWYKKGISWSFITTKDVGFRYLPEGGTFDVQGSTLFLKDELKLCNVLALLNSKPVNSLLRILNPTISLQVKDVRGVPIPDNYSFEKTDNLCNSAIHICKDDWDSYETSLDFTSLPLLQVTSDQCPVASEEENPEFQLSTGHYPLDTKLSFSYAKLRAHWQEMTQEMQCLEEENNRIFIDAYGLQDELTPEVLLNEITLTCNPHYRFSSVASGQGLVTREEELEAKLLADTMKEFISYAVGCMFGRYSLDAPGLILANQGEGLEDYYRIVSNQLSVISNQQEEKADYCTLTSDGSSDGFPPDADNVIPILDGDWFPDDITERFRKFLRVTFGEEHYEENLKFIEVALGKDIRKYFLKDFYNDHLRRYKKRPIYWLFSSPKGSFNALIYMHRYRPDTVSVVLNGYLREFRTKLLSRKSQLEAVSISASASPGEKTKALKEIDSLRKMIEELESYERDVLYPLATEQIAIDLDDGVKVNYQKFGPALKKIPGLDTKEE